MKMLKQFFMESFKDEIREEGKVLVLRKQNESIFD